MATNAIGTNIEVAGWALTQEVTQPSGDYSAEYRGNMDNLADALNKVKETANYDDVNVSVDADTGVATITIGRGANNGNTKIPDGQTRMPTCNIQGSMLSPKLHQCPSLNKVTEGETTADSLISLDELKCIEWCLKNHGVVTEGDLFFSKANVKMLARWRMFGLDTYLSPSYTMTLSFYLNSSQKAEVNAFVKEAGKVWKFATAIALLPVAVRPTDLGVPAWLAQAPSISYTKDGITVSQAFIGAEKFPSFYEAEEEGLVYDPPAIPDGYWRDSKWFQQQQTSGEEA